MGNLLECEPAAALLALSNKTDDSKPPAVGALVDTGGVFSAAAGFPGGFKVSSSSLLIHHADAQKNAHNDCRPNAAS